MQAPLEHTELAEPEVSGGYIEGVPPVPIPNTEVKPFRADGTARFPCGRVGRCRNIIETPRRSILSRGAFFIWGREAAILQLDGGPRCVSRAAVLSFSLAVGMTGPRPERSYRYFDPVGDDAAPRLGIREWKAGGVRILEVRVQEIVPGSKRYFCVDTRKASFYLDGGRDTALYAIFDGETTRWLVRADVVVNDPPNIAEAMQFPPLSYHAVDPEPGKT